MAPTNTNGLASSRAEFEAHKWSVSASTPDQAILIKVLDRSRQPNSRPPPHQGHRIWVWVPDHELGYISGRVVKEEGATSTVSCGSPQVLKQVPTIDLHPVNSPDYDGTPDMADLPSNNEAGVVHNLRTRYQDNNIYTYSGLFLVAVNPYRSLPIYAPQTIEKYKNKRREENAPHVYAVAEQAWQNMLASRDQSQSVLVTGESGAGKTENTKKVIQYLAAIAADPLPSSSSVDLLARQAAADRQLDPATGKKLGQLERQILEANPILEAFGNAQTMKNNNSSRFGKFVRIYFNGAGAIAGANVDWYLLEKSRVTGRGAGERNFHVFFQLLRGADGKLKEQLLLKGKPTDYEYLKHSRQDVDGMDDVKEWAALRAALDTVGFSPDEQLDSFKIMAAILHLGNVGVAGTSVAHLQDPTQLAKICFLLGLDETEFQTALVRPKVRAGKEWVTQSRTPEQVTIELAALAKTLYERNFGAVVARINRALGRPSTKTFIGVLDIAGFEIFETNGFEQLCINLTNEKLQQFFNHHMFEREQKEYETEGIKWSHLTFGAQLQPTIDLIESTNPMGILASLDDASIMTQTSDKEFTEKLNSLARQKPVAPQFERYTPSRIHQGFTVKHYAGEVEYRTDGWLAKNKDPLNEAITSLLARSTDQRVASMFADFAEPAPEAAPGSGLIARGPRVRKGAFRTVGARHREQLAFLMNQLNETQPHFVRCIVPNLNKSPLQIDVPLVLDQLRCNGVLEGIRIARMGYPNRLPFAEFRRRFELLAPGLIKRGAFVDGKEACTKIVNHLELDKESYMMGLTKVFLKAGILAELEARRDVYLAALATRIQAACRRFIARRQATKILHRAAAIRTIQRNARIYIQLRSWPWWPLFQRVRPLLAAARSDDELRRKEAELAAIREAAEREAQHRAQLEATQVELEQAQAKMAEALASEQAQTEEMAGLLSVARERALQLEKDAADAQAEYETLNGYLEKAMEAKGALMQQVAELHDAHANQSKLLEVLQAEQTAWKAQQAEMAGKASVEKDEWDKVMRERDESKAAASELRRQVSEAGQDRRREQQRVQDQIASLERQLASEAKAAKAAKEVRQQLQAVEAKAKAATDEVGGVQQQRKAAEAALKTKNAELERLMMAHTSLVAERDAAVSKARTTEARLAEAAKEAADNARKLSISAETEKTALAKVEALTKLLEEKSSDASRTAELHKLQQVEVTDLRKQLDKTATDLALAQREALRETQALRDQLEAAKREAADLKVARSELDRRASTAERRVGSLEAANAELERIKEGHDLKIQLVQSAAAEEMLKEREKFEKEAAAVRAQFQELEDAAVAAKREREAAVRELTTTAAALEEERAGGEEARKRVKALEDKVDRQHAVLVDFDTINGNLRRELGQTKGDLQLALSKNGPKIVEHYRVLEESQRLQNAEMIQMRADVAKREAYIRTLESARDKLTQSIEDMQHERDAERRQAWSAAHNAPKPAPSPTAVELDRERKLRQEAELNVARFRSEIQHQQAQLGALTSERDELKRSLARVEAELVGVAASDHTQQMAYPSSYPSTAAQAAPPRERLQESRAGNAFVGGIRAVPPSVTKPGMPVVTSRRGKYE